MSKHSRRRRRDNTPEPIGGVEAEATYVCDSCGEEIVVPVDITAGAHQDYVEDCPVCCHPMRLHVEVDRDGGTWVQGEHE